MSDETPPLDPNDPEIARDPRKMYKLMRDLAPVVEMEQNARKGTIVSKHEDALEILRNPEIFSSNDDAIDIGMIKSFCADPPSS